MAGDTRIGDWIRAKRAERGLQIQHCAREAGVHPESWTAWESHGVRPAIFRAAGIARALGVQSVEVLAVLEGRVS